MEKFKILVSKDFRQVKRGGSETLVEQISDNFDLILKIGEN